MEIITIHLRANYVQTKCRCAILAITIPTIKYKKNKTAKHLPSIEVMLILLR